MKQSLAQWYLRGWEGCPNFDYMHSAEEACDITLDDETNGNIIDCCNNTHPECHDQQTICINVLRMQRQPEACASDLGDNQSCYLCM